MERVRPNRIYWLGSAALIGCLTAAAPAFAANECGPLVGGGVTCIGSFPNGIAYTSAGSLTVTTRSDAVVGGTINAASTVGTATATVAANAPVTTTAVNTRGISVTGAGDVAVSATTVRTSGAGSAGIVALSSNGGVSVTSNTVAVAAAGGPGILAIGRGPVTITAANASAIDNSAIFATSVTGATTVSITGAVTSTIADAAVVANSGAAVTINVSAGASVTGTNAFTTSSAAGTTITNAGTLTGTNGYVVLANQGVTTLINSGTVTGRVDIGGPNNNIVGGKFINSGTFNVTGFSLFGAGATSLTNSGTVQVPAGAPTSGLTFFGLAAFNNSGVVSLANGRTGDVLTTSGAFAGSGASALTLDAATGTTNAADRLVIGGAATGTTTVTLANVGGGAALLNPGTIIVQAGAGSGAGAFQLAPGSTASGFIRYDIAYSPTANSYTLVGTPASQAYRPLKYVEAAASISYKAVDAWAAHMRAVRDVPAGGGRLWGQAYGLVENRRTGIVSTVFGQTQAQSLSYRQDYYGGQLGFDIAQLAADGSGVAFGVTGGYISSDLNFFSGPDRASYDAVNGGAYASFKAGPLFVNVLGKYDRYWGKGEASSIGFAAKFHGYTYGATGEAGIRVEGSGFFVEPLVTLTYSRTHLNDFTAFASTFDFHNADGLRGKAGGRLGTSLPLGSSKVTAYAGGNVVKEFRGRDGFTFINNGTAIDLRNQRIGLYGEGYGGITILGAGGVSGFIEGFGDYGRASTLRGGGGRVGIRVPL